jgi:hypothetical protein
LIKTTIYLSLGLHKERPSYRRSLQLSIKTFSTSKHEISKFFLFLWVIFALLDPDPDHLTRLNLNPIRIGSRSESNSDRIKIRIRNPAIILVSLRNRIVSGFNRVSGSGPKLGIRILIQRIKKTDKKKVKTFHVWNC